MADDNDWLKLSTEEKLVHSSWKARQAAYDEIKKIFDQADEKSSEFTKYGGFLKKAAADANAVAQDHALCAIESFLRNASVQIIGRFVFELSPPIVQKCLGAARTSTKEKAIELLLAIVEAEKGEAVFEAVFEALQTKQPKLVVGSLQFLRLAVQQFGVPVCPAKSIVKDAIRLIEDRDKTVREECKALLIDVARFVGVAALKPQLATLSEIVQKQLDGDISSITERAAPTRFLRSQQARAPAANAATSGAATTANTKSNANSAQSKTAEIDPFNFFEAVDVLKLIPSDFYDKIEAKKWQDRKEALESVEKHLKNAQKLADGDYHQLSTVLTKAVQKDVNVMCAGIAIQCLSHLARGLRSKFAPVARELLTDCLFEKLKERKLTAQLRDCLDASFAAAGYQLDPIGESALKELENKNPTVKTEMALFFARSFVKMNTTTLPKKWLKPICAALTRTASDGDPAVREASFEALGAAMRCVGERNIAPFLTELDEARSKKVRESYEKLTSESSGASAPAAAKVEAEETKPKAEAAATAKSGIGGLLSSLKPAGAAAAAQRRPTTAPARETQPASSANSTKAKQGAAAKPSAGSKSVATKKGDNDLLHSEPEMSESEVDAVCTPIVTADAVNQLGDADRKVRLAAMETVQSRVKQLVLAADEDPTRLPTQALVRLLIRKPGLRDNNFQIVKAKLETLRCLLDSEAARLTQSTAEQFVVDTAACLSDAKYVDAARAVLLAIAEHCSLEFLARELLAYAFLNEAAQKDKEKEKDKSPTASPKVQEALLQVLATGLRDFGLQAPLKLLIDALRIAIQSSNAAVRAAAFATIGVVGAFAGAPRVRALFETDQKPAVLAQLDAEFEKQKDAAANPPTRMLRGRKRISGQVDAGGSSVAGGAGSGGPSGEAEPGQAEEDDPFSISEPVDILKSIPSDFQEKVDAKKWQDRKEAYENVEKLLRNAPRLADGDYSQLVATLSKAVQKDVNVMCAAVAIQCLTLLSKGLRNKFAQFARDIFGDVVSERLKEKKLSSQLRELLDASIASLSFSLESVSEELLGLIEGAKSPNAKQELALFLSRLFIHAKFNPNRCLPKGGFYKTLVALLIKYANDGDPAVRDAAFEALGGALRGVGERATVPLLAELDEVKVKKIRDYFDKFGGAKVQAQPAAAPAPAVVNTSRPEATAKTSITAKPSASKAAIKQVGSSESLSETKRPQTAPPKAAQVKAVAKEQARPGTGSPASASKNGRDEASGANKKDDGILLDSALTAKEQRIREEFGSSKSRPGTAGQPSFSSKGGPRWDIVSNLQHASKDHQEALRMQLEPHANRELVDGLLNFTDFKAQLKALDTLLRFVSDSTVQNFIANLDLLFKSLILLNYENNNTTLLLKSIELLQSVLSNLVSLRPRYALGEYEAQLLVPLLLVKLHDSSNNQIAKDKLKALMVRELTLLYPASRVFAFVLDTIGKREFKNAKFRIDCIELLHALVELFGFAMCAATQTGGALQPGAVGTLKQICALLGEQRDTSLRVALVQLLVLINAHVGDAEFARHVAPLLAEKDAQMFEDRKARSRRPGAASQLSQLAQAASSAHLHATAAPAFAPAPSLPPQAAPPVAAAQLAATLSTPASAMIQPTSAVRKSVAASLGGRNVAPTSDDNGDGSKRFCFSSEWDVEPFESELPKLAEVDLAPIFAPFELPRIASTRIGAFGERMSPAQLNALLAELGSSRTEDAVGALVRLKDVLDDSNIADRVLLEDPEALNRIMLCIAQQLATLLVRYVDSVQAHTTDPAETRLVKLLLGTVTNVIDYPRNAQSPAAVQYSMVKHLNSDALHRLCAALCNMLSDDRVLAQFEKTSGGNATQSDLENAGRSAQAILGKLVEHTACTAMLVALGRLVADSARALMLGSTGPTTSERYFDVVTRCATRFLRRLNATRSDKTSVSDELCLEDVFADLDRFLRECPTATWKLKGVVSSAGNGQGQAANANKPFRLLRTIIYQLVTVKGADTLHVAQLVLSSSGSSQKDSELLGLLNKSLKKAIKTNQLATESNGATSLREQLAQIFIRIGVKETSQEGLVELYRFRKRHPQIDVNAFLEKAGENFQKFVNVSLRNIELDEELKRSRESVGNGNYTGNGDDTDITSTHDPIPDEIFTQPDAIRPFFAKRLEALGSRFEANANFAIDELRIGNGSPKNEILGGTGDAGLDFAPAPQFVEATERPTVSITARPAARAEQSDLLAIQRRLAELRAGKK